MQLNIIAELVHNGNHTVVSQFISFPVLLQTGENDLAA